MPGDETAIMTLLQRSFTWQCLSCRDFNPCHHEESGWRCLPFLVIVCPTEGLYHSEVEGIGRVYIQPGEALLVPKGVRHTVAIPGGGVVHYAHIQFTVFDAMDVLSFFKVPPLVKEEAAKAIAETTRDLGVALREPCPPRELVLRATRRQRLANQLLGLVTEVSAINDAATGRLMDIHRLEPTLKHMEGNISRSVNRHELAKLAALSDTRFHYVFKEAMGMSPMAYLKSVRMRQAQLLLFQTELQVAEIGERVGYPDVFHFSKTFKQAFGASPTEYRRETRQWLLESR